MSDNTATEPIGPSGDRLVVHGGELYRVDVTTGALHPTGLDESLGPILSLITSFLSREEHVATLDAHYQGALTGRQLADTVDALLGARLLVRQTDLIDSLPAPPPEPETRIAFVAIPTNKSPDRIADVVRSIRKSDAAGPLKVIVAEQEGVGAVPEESHAVSVGGLPAFAAPSREAENGPARDRSRHPGPKTINEARFREWADVALAPLSDDERSIVERGTALDGEKGFRAGANRNRLMLASAGRRFVSSDDDQPSRLTRFRSDTMLLTSRFNPMEYDPYLDVAERDRELQFEPFDPVQLHGAYLGRPVEEILRECGGAVDIRQVDPRFLQTLRQVGTRVRVTMMGLAGDIGQRTPPLLLVTEGRSLESLLSSGPQYQDRLMSTIGVAATRTLTVTSSPLFRSSHCGFDNSVPLPPFPGWGRNGDGVFGAALVRVFGPGSILHLPAAVEHYSKRSEPLPPEALKDSRYRHNDVLIQLMLRWTPPAVSDDHEQRHAHLAAYVADLAGSTPAAFRSVTTELLAAQTSLLTLNLRQLLARYGRRHKGWRRDAEGMLDLLEDRIAAGEFLDDGITWDSLQQHVTEYARLLRVWPAAWRAAKAAPMEELAGA